MASVRVLALLEGVSASRRQGLRLRVRHAVRSSLKNPETDAPDVRHSLSFWADRDSEQQWLPRCLRILVNELNDSAFSSRSIHPVTPEWSPNWAFLKPSCFGAACDTFRARARRASRSLHRARERAWRRGGRCSSGLHTRTREVVRVLARTSSIESSLTRALHPPPPGLSSVSVVQTVLQASLPISGFVMGNSDECGE